MIEVILIGLVFAQVVLPGATVFSDGAGGTVSAADKLTKSLRTQDVDNRRVLEEILVVLREIKCLLLKDE